MMLDRLQRTYPLEGCGLLGGQNGRITTHYAIDNVLQSLVAYEMDPKQQLQAMLDIEARGLDLLAIYHSHPQGPEQPSLTDIAQAYYPETIQLIISLRDRNKPVLRGFTIRGGQVSEVSLQIEAVLEIGEKVSDENKRQ